MGNFEIHLTFFFVLCINRKAWNTFLSVLKCFMLLWKCLHQCNFWYCVLIIYSLRGVPRKKILNLITIILKIYNVTAFYILQRQLSSRTRTLKTGIISVVCCRLSSCSAFDLKKKKRMKAVYNYSVVSSIFHIEISVHSHGIRQMIRLRNLLLQPGDWQVKLFLL